MLEKANALWSKLPIRYVGGALLAIPAICLTTAMGVWIISQRVNQGIYQEIGQSRNRLFQIKDLFIHILNAETGTRGFTLTRDPSYLEPYKRATVQIPIILNKLEADSAISSSDTLEQIQKLSQRRLKLLELRINSAKINTSDLMLPEERTYIMEGKQVMDRFRVLVDRLETQESQKLFNYEKRIKRNREIGDLLILITSSLSLLVYLKLIYLFSKIDWQLAGQKLELSESNFILETVMNKVVDGVITVNQKDKIDSFNHSAAEMFGCMTEEAIGQEINNFIIPNSRKKSSIEMWLDPSDAPFLAVGNRQIGSNFPIEISVSKLLSGNRKMLIFRDITERQEAQQKLESHIKELSRLSLMLSKANQALTDRNQELDQFAYVASHDLKAPLRAISSLSEWIEEDLGDKLPAETHHQMQLLRQRVSRMEALINGLLEYCRVGRTQTQNETVSVSILIKEVVDSLGIPPTFNIEIDPNLPTIIAKTLLLRQVFANLISNAVKHQVSDRGNIKISSQELDKFYEFSVTDDGIGIAPEYQEQIFRIFQTLEARDTRDNTGIGLAIVKKIVESEGGKIWVVSATGEGATFSFTWRKQPKD